MDKEQKTLKSPLSAIFDSCDELKAKAAGEAQKSLAREVLSQLEFIETALGELKSLVKEVLG